MHEDLASFFGGMRDYLHETAGAADFVSGVGTANAEGLALYRWLVLADRRALLEDAAPLARAACDADAWDALTERYIATCPTLEWDTARYADGFAAFLASRSDEGVLPRYVSELAELSLLRRRAFLSTVEFGRTVLDETVFVRLFSHDVRSARAVCGARSEPLELEERPCVLIIYRSCASGLALSIDGTAARVIALLDALEQPVLPAMRDSISAVSRVAALVELSEAGVLPRA